MDEKGQGSLEVLLLLAAAILIASIVGLYIKNLSTGDIGNRFENVTGNLSNQLGDL